MFIKNYFNQIYSGLTRAGIELETTALLLDVRFRESTDLRQT